MAWTWFDRYWSSLGLALALVMLAGLLFTDVFLRDRGMSRWRDPTWLAWALWPAYMIHQFEEYGVDALGRSFAFPDVLCATLGQPAYPACAVPEAFFVAVNVPGLWAAGLVCALLAPARPLVGLALTGVHGVNAVVHLGASLASGDYNPGALTAALIQLPLALWVWFTCFGPGRRGRFGVLALVLAGVLAHGVLFGSLQLFTAGSIGAGLLLAVQWLNPVLFVAIPFVAERWVRQTPPGRR